MYLIKIDIILTYLYLFSIQRGWNRHIENSVCDDSIISTIVDTCRDFCLFRVVRPYIQRTCKIQTILCAEIIKCANAGISSCVKTCVRPAPILTVC